MNTSNTTGRPAGKTGPIAAAVMRSNLADVCAEEAGVRPPWPAGYHWFLSLVRMGTNIVDRHLDARFADEEIAARSA